MAGVSGNTITGDMVAEKTREDRAEKSVTAECAGAQLDKRVVIQIIRGHYCVVCFLILLVTAPQLAI